MAKVTKKATKAPSKKPPVSHAKSALITWIIVIAIVVSLAGGYMIAKVKYTHYISQISVMFSEKDTELNKMKAKMNEMNGVMKVGGKMMIMRDGKVSMLTEQITLEDGTVVMPNGRYQKPEGEKVMMQNGEGFDLKGNMMSEDENKIEF